MLGTFAIGQLDLRIVPASFGDGGLEIVEHDALGHTTEELEGVTVEHEARSRHSGPTQIRRTGGG